METIDLSESETDKVRAVGTKFVDQLIQEKILNSWIRNITE